MKIGGEEFPESCPKRCPEKNKPFYQGNVCYRCPIFNCSSADPDTRMLEPEEYRYDWAKAFKKWIEDDFNGSPELYL